MTIEQTTDTPRGMRIAAAWLDQIRAATHHARPDQADTDRIVKECYRERPCNDCGAPIGTPHIGDCDVARCLHNGRQRFQCDGGTCDADCDSGDFYSRAHHNTFHANGPHDDCGADIWDGVWPGTEECVQLGWYSYFVGQNDISWVPCGPEHPAATPDLNRLGFSTTWDRERQRWVAPDKAEAGR